MTLVPGLEDAAITDMRAGLRPRGPDDLPIIGRSQAVPGLIYATGHYRNGVLLAPLTAQLVGDLVFERACRSRRCADLRSERALAALRLRVLTAVLT